MLNCRDASQLISKGQDRPLSLRERVALRLHLWMCRSCRLFDGQLHFLRTSLRHGWRQGELPAARILPDAARERIRQVLKERSGD